MDPIEMESKIDELLARILLADDLKQAQGYAQQIIRLREHIQAELDALLEEGMTQG